MGSLQRQVAFFWYDNDKDANICFLVTQLIFLCLIYPQVEEFNIITNYAKLLPENKVPVGVWQCLSRAIFMCQLKETDTFGDCCEVSVIQFSILLPQNMVPMGSDRVCPGPSSCVNSKKLIRSGTAVRLV